MNHYLVGILCLILSLCGIGCTSHVEATLANQTAVVATDDDDSRKHFQRMEDLEYLCASLEALHPDMYRNVSKETVLHKQEEIIAKLDDLDDFSFAVELQTLVAMIGDSHTTINVNSLVDENMRMLPIRLKQFDGECLLSTVPSEFERYLGWELLSINGHPMSEVYKAFSPFISHDNEVKLQRQFLSSFYVVPLLRHFGIVDDESSIELIVESSAGDVESIVVPVISASAARTFSVSQLSQLRQAIPETEWDRSRNYKAFPLGTDTLYIQYNVCQEDKDLPMDEFVLQLRRMMDTVDYSKILIDLRNNGGGSDGVLIPVLDWLVDCMKAGKQAYALIGETTFSSAVINGVMLQMIGVPLVGTPTSGNVNHFGAVNVCTLPNLPIQVRYSTKYIDLAEFFGMPGRYGDSPLMPDVVVEQTFTDYLAGVDTAVEYLLSLK